MKKIILLFACVLPIFCNAQFVATPTGMKAENGEDYYVYDMEGKTASEIYTGVVKAITSMYASPKDVMTTVQNEMVTLNGISEGPYIKVMGFTSGYYTNYTIVFKFKDGKLRVDAPHVNNIYNDEWRTLGFSSLGPYKNRYIFKKNGNVTHQLSKDTLESLFNDLINKIVANITSESKDDW